VIDELGIDVSEEQLLSAEEYLEDRGYLERADISLTMGTYTITPVGLKWLETGIPGRAEAHETVEEQQGRGHSPNPLREGHRRAHGGAGGGGGSVANIRRGHYGVHLVLPWSA
jgi:hypothetical protein